jgi:hypothetical protein
MDLKLFTRSRRIFLMSWLTDAASVYATPLLQSKESDDREPVPVSAIV